MALAAEARRNIDVVLKEGTARMADSALVRRVFSDLAPPSIVDATDLLALPSSVAGSSTWSSPVLPSFGMNHIAASCKASQAGTLTLTKYFDQIGTIAAGAPVTQSLSANTLAMLDHSSTALFQSYTISVTVSGGAPATLSDVLLLMAGN